MFFKKDIIIYGYGGFAFEVASLICKINTYNLIGFVDDNPSLVNLSSPYGRVLGDFNFLNRYNNKVNVVFAFTNSELKNKLYKNLINKNISFPNIISNDCLIYNKNLVKIGIGNIIMYQCLLSCNVTIGDFNLMNCGTSIGHDSIIGSFNSFMSYAKISGQVNIGDSNYFGACSLVLQQKIIGNQTVIGASSVIMRNTEDENTYLGNPAIKILKPKIK
jgi:sugar O-acyltransferase (sialic acid O-acetyltransferase NeuD family)